ncbi:MAG: hypothetical protein EHM65_06890 [Acidobacteriales bacterium]|nr:MAG: hypothetical protein EHM65_06890 [Terriglobales bacterium]
MFFRHHSPRVISFEERLEGLRAAGFQVEPVSLQRVKVRRDCCAAVVEQSPEGVPLVSSLGIVAGDQIAELVDGGYQKFFEVAGGQPRPALAPDLKALHDFQEELRQALGLTSLYNEALGTICDRHSYDRLRGRD